MATTRSAQAIIPILTFIAGFFVHLAWSNATKKEPENKPKPDHVAPKPIAERENSLTREPAEQTPGSDLDRPESEPERQLVLSGRAVDGILTGGSLKRKLSRMGFSEEQIAEIDSIKEAGIESFMLIEKEHAETKSDERGDYVEINPFPEKRLEWIATLESDLRAIAKDDRAAIVARLISFTDNDEAVGLYRRELFITDPPEGQTGMRIEERTFNAKNQLTDIDYDIVTSTSKTRWRYLLDLSGE